MDPNVIQALDECRALTLGLLEVLNEKLAPGSYQKVLSKEDVEKVFEKQATLVKRFREERDERNRGLVLPPGARS